MAPSTLDLFILTFNCAKNFINPPVFAAHLHGALSQNATGLPDLVVFSLQEVAPLSYAFIGSYFLNPYYARFGEALNLASAKVLATTDGHDGDAPSTGRAAAGSPPYTLVRAKNVGMTAILMYARDATAIQRIEEAECGFGAADMGNKGAVGLRVTWSGQHQTQQQEGETATGAEQVKTTEFTFIAAHLAAMEWNLKKRNANWRSIVAGLTFANPRAILPGVFPANRASPPPDRSGAGDIAPRLPTGDSPDPSEEEPESSPSSDADNDEGQEGDTHPLLPEENRDPINGNDASTFAALQQISIYKPSSHLFVAGDLNYRIASTTPPPLAAFPSFDPSSEHHYATFLPRDQLTRERLAGRTLHGLSEANIAFGPTYKFDILPPVAPGAAEEEGSGDSAVAAAAAAAAAAAETTGAGEARWKFAPHRWPGWCDRVLYLDVPRSVPGRSDSEDGGKDDDSNYGHINAKVDVSAYDALPVVATSDHRAVFFRARVPLLDEDEMRSSLAAAVLREEDEDSSGGPAVGVIDPRLRLPVPVDVHAWERRAAARRKEMIVGWTGFLWSTREGAIVLTTVLALGVGSWWLMRVW
ncbi:Endonuclease/exonuclease/phosphatase [Corynascus novoguineensis]|uniref:Endonuclease/exonuclease/phosphatase n=1 Tax=Corynascus novoguineensis TaxID=1126955 RepID=A0AAN7HU27_9PEZI|nr:Endonuclease/exonuclease/phosphatase [Corynascus novoguineensis]